MAMNKEGCIRQPLLCAGSAQIQPPFVRCHALSQSGPFKPSAHHDQIKRFRHNDLPFPNQNLLCCVAPASSPDDLFAVLQTSLKFRKVPNERDILASIYLSH